MLCTSDLHANQTFADNIVKRLDEGDIDIWLGCGDFVNNEYAIALFDRVNVPGFAVPGNLDWGLKYDGKVKFLEDDIVECKGYQFFCLADMVMPDLKRFENIDPKKLIFVTHYPPYGVLDLIWSGKRVGSYDFRKFLEVQKPLLHAFGHIHEANGIEKFRETLAVNCALTGSGTSYIVDLPTLKVEEFDMGI